MVRAKKGNYFFSFNPAISDEAAKQIRAQIRRWRLHLRSGWTLEQAQVDRHEDGPQI
jgi:hypothetical protein